MEPHEPGYKLRNVLQLHLSRHEARLSFLAAFLIALLRVKTIATHPNSARSPAECTRARSPSVPELRKSGSQTSLHIDYIILLAKGSINDLSNLPTLCLRCNLSKGDPAIPNSKRLRGVGCWPRRRAKEHELNW
jgi:5-methylcytosine-specific restriction endonuclease McrA